MMTQAKGLEERVETRTICMANDIKGSISGAGYNAIWAYEGSSTRVFVCC
jgi:hypothetical protein